ncbi:MAG: hypothetical protein LBU27_05765 [Candidatus Peribacteria bacterium]|jgi:hypothetical protein|nr:hypothetical protein [Candidatus Peribacteria bacterium]
MKFNQSTTPWITEGLPRNIFIGKKVSLQEGVFQDEQGKTVPPAAVILVQQVSKDVVQCFMDFPPEKANPNALFYQDTDGEIQKYLGGFSSLNIPFEILAQ